MLKKILAWLLVISTTATIAIGGTLAYFTDRDSEANVFTVGDVKIDLEEDFQQGAELIPGVEIEKKPTVTNIGPNDAWVWLEFAIPTALDNFVQGTEVGSNENVIHWNPKGATTEGYVTDARVQDAIAAGFFGEMDTSSLSAEYINENKMHWNVFNSLGEGKNAYQTKIEVDGKEVAYNVYVLLYNKALTPGETTLPNIEKVFLDARVDIDPDGNWNFVENGVATPIDWNSEEDGAPVIYVSAYAMQKENFATVGEAYAAYQTQWGDNGSEYADPSADEADAWDGTADTSWYNDTDTEFTLTTAEQLAGFAELVDGGNTFAGKTVKLGADLDLYAVDEDGNKIGFNPIGHSSNGKSFNGTFDGQNYTISKMYQQSNLDSNNGGWLYEGQYYGLFAYTNGATIKNVIVADAYVSSGRNEAAAVVGNAVDTTFTDITVSNTTLIAYNNSAGGVASECYGNCSFTNITVDEDTVIGPLWGTYDVRLGGVVGLVHAGNNVSFSNVNVACKLDAINDVAANYQYWLYRYCGMLIGHVDGVNGVADPTGYVTCENVTVTYGDWVNYHYCEDADLGAGSYNGSGEYKYARVEAGTGTNGIDLSACNHNADESHNVLIVFDQLFGGGQGIKGLKTYDGVTVNYPD